LTKLNMITNCSTAANCSSAHATSAVTSAGFGNQCEGVGDTCSPSSPGS